jgi:hypothetical protein
MYDPILEEIRRVREELVKKHGGFDGYFKYVQKLDPVPSADGKEAGRTAPRAAGVREKRAEFPAASDRHTERSPAP